MIYNGKCYISAIFIDVLRNKKLVSAPNKQETHTLPKRNLSGKGKIFFGFVMLAAILLICASAMLAVPHFIYGVENVHAYKNMTWAHDQLLISQFIQVMMMIWLMLSALFWGGWMLNRAMRKLKGNSWRIQTINSRLRFFPPVNLYLKVSCIYLLIIFLFTVFQYPLQYMIYPSGG